MASFPPSHFSSLDFAPFRLLDSVLTLLPLLPHSVVFGNSNGLAVVDYVQKTVVLNLGTVELYGSNDPYQRQPRSPRKTRQPSGGKKTKKGKLVTGQRMLGQGRLPVLVVSCSNFLVPCPAIPCFNMEGQVTQSGAFPGICKSRKLPEQGHTPKYYLMPLET